MSKMSKTIAVLGVVAGLGVAALPLSTYAATGPATDPENVNLNVTVSNEIELAVKAGSETVNINAVNGAAVDGQTGDATLVVTTAATGGYTLWAKTADVNLSDSAATPNTIAAGVPTTGSSAWGMLYSGGDKATGDFGNYKGLMTTSQIVRKTSTVMADTTNGDETTVTFGVTASAGQAAGVYTGTATFTAAANI